MSHTGMQDPQDLEPRLDEIWKDPSFVESMDDLYKHSLDHSVHMNERILGALTHRTATQKSSEQSSTDEKQPHSPTALKFSTSIQGEEEYQKLMTLDDEQWDANAAKLGEGMSNDVPEEMLWYVKWLEDNPDNGRDTPMEVDDKSSEEADEADDSDASSILTHPSDCSSSSSNGTFQCSIQGCTDIIRLEFEEVKKHFRNSPKHYGGVKAARNKSHDCPIGGCQWVTKGTRSDRNRLAEHLCSSEHYNVGMRCPLCNAKQKSGRLSSSKRHREGEAGKPGACKVCKGCRRKFSTGKERTEHENTCLLK